MDKWPSLVYERLDQLIKASRCLIEIQDDMLNGHAAHGTSSPGLLEAFSTILAAALVNTATKMQIVSKLHMLMRMQ